VKWLTKGKWETLCDNLHVLSKSLCRRLKRVIGKD